MIQTPDIQLLLLDIDGVLRDQQEHSEKTLFADIARLREHGVVAGILSHRPFGLSKELWKTGAFSYGAFSEGAFCIDTKNCSFHAQSLNNKLSQFMLQIGGKLKDSRVLISCGDLVYGNNYAIDHYSIYGDILSIDSIDNPQLDHVDSIWLKDVPGTISQRIIDSFPKAPLLSKKRRNGAFDLYLLPTVEGKLCGLDAIQSKAQVPFSKIAFMGDSISDIPALKKVGFSVAPENAVEKVKTVVSYVTNSSCSKGVLELVSYIKEVVPSCSCGETL